MQIENKQNAQTLKHNGDCSSWKSLLMENTNFLCPELCSFMLTAKQVLFQWRWIINSLSIDTNQYYRSTNRRRNENEEKKINSDNYKCYRSHVCHFHCFQNVCTHDNVRSVWHGSTCYVRCPSIRFCLFAREKL